MFFLFFGVFFSPRRRRRANGKAATAVGCFFARYFPFPSNNCPLDVFVCSMHSQRGEKKAEKDLERSLTDASKNFLLEKNNNQTRRPPRTSPTSSATGPSPATAPTTSWSSRATKTPRRTRAGSMTRAKTRARREERGAREASGGRASRPPSSAPCFGFVLFCFWWFWGERGCCCCWLA